MIFDEDGEDLVALCSWSLGNVKKDAIDKVITACNSLNDYYRWVRFCVDSDGDITVSTDAIVNMETVGDIYLRLVNRIVDIGDEAYPTLMKARWS